MGDVLAYIEPVGSEKLLDWARPLADAAGGDLVALVVAGTVDAGLLAPADVVLEVSHPALAQYTPEAHRAVVAAAIAERKPDVVVFVNTTAGLDLGPAAAVAAGLPFVNYVVELSVASGEAEAVSSAYGGVLLASSTTPLPAVFSINAGAMHPEPAAAGRGEQATLAPPAELDSLRTTFVEAVVPPDEGVDLTKADLIVCVGRGIGDADSISVAQELVSALGAELGASRPVVDSGWLPKSRQIGKSGAHVKPKVYLSLGVSGAPEHLEGMQDSETIIAINKDAGAAIFNVAHYGVVADLFDVAEQLTSLAGDGS
ncbi:MAG: electron transfer flavoprotein subunit alpha/FixB family protein [Solirubrobacteraceae bacterium]